MYQFFFNCSSLSVSSVRYLNQFKSVYKVKSAYVTWYDSYCTPMFKGQLCQIIFNFWVNLFVAGNKWGRCQQWKVAPKVLNFYPLGDRNVYMLIMSNSVVCFISWSFLSAALLKFVYQNVKRITNSIELTAKNCSYPYE